MRDDNDVRTFSQFTHERNVASPIVPLYIGQSGKECVVLSYPHASFTSIKRVVSHSSRILHQPITLAEVNHVVKAIKITNLLDQVVLW